MPSFVQSADFQLVIGRTFSVHCPIPIGQRKITFFEDALEIEFELPQHKSVPCWEDRTPVGGVPALGIILCWCHGHHPIYVPHHKQIIRTDVLDGTANPEVLGGRPCEFILELFDSVAVVCESGCVLENIRASDTHHFLQL